MSKIMKIIHRSRVAPNIIDRWECEIVGNKFTVLAQSTTEQRLIESPQDAAGRPLCRLVGVPPKTDPFRNSSN